MESWDYRQPVEIHFGSGSMQYISEAIKRVGGKHGLLITSPSFVRNGKADTLVTLSGGAIDAIDASVSPNPDVTHCDACAELIRQHGYDFVVALGGGSVIDCAKAAAAISLSDKPAACYLDGMPLPQSALPLIAMPTTAGTGSEVTSVAVISDHTRGLKVPLSADTLYPRIAIVDPMLTAGMSPYLTACTGFDVLCHAIEAYWSRRHQPVCDALAIKAARLVLDNLLEARQPLPSAKAREHMAEASVLAGLAFAQPRTNSAHVCSYPLTSRYGIPHGEACAMTIDHFIRFNAANGCQRTMSLAHALGFVSPEALAVRISNLKQNCDLRLGLAEFKLTHADIESLADACMHPNMTSNPVKVTYSDLLDLFTVLAAK